MTPLDAARESTGRQQLSLPQANREDSEPVYRGLGRVVHALCSALVTRRWFNSDKVPSSGGVVIVSNHMSYFDALVLGEYLIWSGRWPRFLGKVELWKVPVVGWLARSTGQIPVHRRTARAGDALVRAKAALEDGKAVTIFPEGTETRDPELWPMSAHTGAARLALQGGWPVVTVAQWGAQTVMPGPSVSFPRFWPRKTVTLLCGGEVDLDDLRVHVGAEQENLAVRAATDRIMDKLTADLADIRGEQPPGEGRWQMATETRVPSNPGMPAQDD